ncbi:MAG: hypothetical protein HYX32_04930 [Actinobacteria bacterium]|nr:hypothetical protein [Actinomycetota bacterium]
MVDTRHDSESLVPDAVAPVRHRVFNSAIATALVVLVATAAWLVWANGATDAARATSAAQGSQRDELEGQLAAAEAEMSAVRAQLQSLLARLDTASTALEGATNQRDDVAKLASSLRVEMFTLQAALNNSSATVFVQGQQLGRMGDCLRSVDQALNALSGTNNREFGRAILSAADASCQEVRSYLQSKGLTP